MGVVSQGCSMAIDVCACMCGYGVGIARQSSDMRLHSPVGVGEWYIGLSSLVRVLLGCTALMRAKSPNIHLDVCSLPKIDVIRRKH